MITYTQQSKVIIFCPPKKVTGGPEALHQLSDKLLHLGNKNVFMYYTPKKKDAKPQNYSVYSTQEIDVVEDIQENILIIPESMTYLVKKYPKSQKIIWWLSVNYYKAVMDLRIRRQNIFTKLFYRQKDREYNFEQLPNVFHWAQSYRSSIYLKNHNIPEAQIDYVCDYINPIFLKNKKKTQKDLTNRTILYNPNKGKKEIPELIKSSPELVWIPIQNMTAQEIKNLMAKSLLYVDFGENPGRDKMLRESVSQDCCIISGKNGSSVYYEDLMIPDEYKFNFSKENIPHIIEKIKEIMDKYFEHIPKFVPYKEMVLNEEILFEEKLKETFKK
ncbi:hypothetical protein HZP56_09765 [Elizabethkingia anophelis]|uniref:hypothetical protein n=1 Tax=Elizabethkingia anophelis TaxID=1117645 RepID=UPI0021A84824|nr:hypothetical protein [Elizabethkingia anophelis]MCT3835147.1 hypothetical protein [Elizabethkingia anophelis]MCT3978301.1 hypothetical protein [Elizabethkingia anophelis]MCT4042099.1 hypothetical protein [Elizabethkingia anophelis]MCT4173264.1 hypothetical protein [Elizabethkingia anophelis]